MRILLDANVLIDLFARREPFCGDASRFLVMHEFGDAEIWASAKSYTDIFSVLSKQFAYDQIQTAFTESLQWLHICSIDGSDIEVAANRCWRDFEDCLVNVCAEKVKADFLITRDIEGFASSKIKTYTPSGFFEMLEQQYGLVYDSIDF